MHNFKLWHLNPLPWERKRLFLHLFKWKSVTTAMAFWISTRKILHNMISADFLQLCYYLGGLYSHRIIEYSDLKGPTRIKSSVWVNGLFVNAVGDSTSSAYSSGVSCGVTSSECGVPAPEAVHLPRVAVSWAEASPERDQEHSPLHLQWW